MICAPANCRIRPAVTSSAASGLSKPWMVSGVGRETAMVVSSHAGGAAYGGTPTDTSVIDAIAEIKARGLKVTLYPFVMMDVRGRQRPARSVWRSDAAGLSVARPRSRASPAPLQAGYGRQRRRRHGPRSRRFAARRRAATFQIDGDTIAFSGSPADWGYRRFVLHYAQLATAAGGVDAFLIGSELRGLTTLRDQDDAFPFVEQLCALAADARLILGPATKITYGADWSEYFGHHPADGTGDVYFHLDPLWAHPAIDAVGIDNYMPLSDWRDGDYSAANPDGLPVPMIPAGLRAAIAGGRGLRLVLSEPWSARCARTRARSPTAPTASPGCFATRIWRAGGRSRITTGSAGWRPATPTAWVPRSKADLVHRTRLPGRRQGAEPAECLSRPEIDAKALRRISRAAAAPISRSGASRGACRRTGIPAAPSFEAAHNPLSPVYGGRMVDASRCYVWAWDARPFPAFPLRATSGRTAATGISATG